MDVEFTKWLATLGVNGALAGMMFLFYRKDMKLYTSLWERQTSTLIELVQENTASNVRLSLLLEGMHRRLDRPEIERVTRPGREREGKVKA